MKLTIGEKIAVLRKEKNISQTELAEYLFLAPLMTLENVLEALQKLTYRVLARAESNN